MAPDPAAKRDKGTMATALKDPRIQLSDQRLFREHCYIDGAGSAPTTAR